MQVKRQLFDKWVMTLGCGWYVLDVGELALLAVYWCCNSSICLNLISIFNLPKLLLIDYLTFLWSFLFEETMNSISHFSPWMVLLASQSSRPQFQVSATRVFSYNNHFYTCFDGVWFCLVTRSLLSVVFLKILHCLHPSFFDSICLNQKGNFLMQFCIID